MFKCYLCDKEFSSSRALGGHTGGHARQGKKREWRQKRNCTFCGTATFNKKYCSAFCSHRGRRHQQVTMKNSSDGRTVVLTGITRDELEELRASTLLCEICGKPERMVHFKSGKVNRLAVDHDHKTGAFRGLLCRRCNGILEWYETNQEAIEKYMQRGVSPLPDKE